MKTKFVRVFIVCLVATVAFLAGNRWLNFQSIGINTNVARTLNSNYTIHASRAARVYYSINFAGTVNLATAAQSGTAFLEFTYPFDPTNWIIVSEIETSTSLAIAIALGLTQGDTKILCGDIPAGCTVRIRTVTTGNMTTTYKRGTEMIY